MLTTGIDGPSFVATSLVVQSRYLIRKFRKRSIFRPFFSCIYRRTNIAIFVRFSNRDFAPQMTSERETAIMFVVFLSRYKLVKEFLRYLYSSRNGAIPNISPKTTKNDPTLEPPGGRTFNQDLDDRIIAYQTISFILRTMALVSFPNFE